MIKNMERAEWDKAAAHAKARGESMASFAARAFRQMREREASAPMVYMPDHRDAGQPSAGAALGQPSGAALPLPLIIESVGELAALMHGAAAMATAAGVKLPEGHARDALALARASVGEALRAARGSRPKGEQPEALRLANERKAEAARVRRLAQSVRAW